MQDTQTVFKPQETQWPAKADLHRYQVFVFRGKLLKQCRRV